MEEFEVLTRIKREYKVKTDFEAKKILQEYDSWGLKLVKTNDGYQYKWVF